MKPFQLAALIAMAACGTESTSFRTTDHGDGSEHAAAVYVVRDVAQVRVWSNGGYIGSSEEPMTHVGFEIHNTSGRAISFDADALGLAVFDKYGAPLPATRYVAVTPLGPAQVPIASGTTATLDSYFLLPVRPRTVETMSVRWTLQLGDARAAQITTFVRDDDYPVTEPPTADPGHTST
ncbi:MAG TPA: hypothetical protein VFQ65_32920 [Kofleriaceae bacterium]|nr:hypothetical protein [Kofleriaceae bacterium]